MIANCSRSLNLSSFCKRDWMKQAHTVPMQAAQCGGKSCSDYETRSEKNWQDEIRARWTFLITFQNILNSCRINLCQITDWQMCQNRFGFCTTVSFQRTKKETIAQSLWLPFWNGLTCICTRQHTRNLIIAKHHWLDWINFSCGSPGWMLHDGSSLKPFTILYFA